MAPRGEFTSLGGGGGIQSTPSGGPLIAQDVLLAGVGPIVAASPVIFNVTL